jgi:HTH-type transcriptional regulator / antitoxin HigA
MDIRPIRTREDHVAALREIDALWGAPEGTDEGDRLDVLLALVESYEARTWPEPPEGDPVSVIRYVMAENDYSQKDLAEVLGSKSRASEILHGRRELTLEHIRKISRAWHVPAGALIGSMEDAAR